MAWFTAAGTGRIARKGVTSVAERSGPIIRNFPLATGATCPTIGHAPCHRHTAGAAIRTQPHRKSPASGRAKESPARGGAFRWCVGVRLLDVQERAQLSGAARVAQLAQRLGLDQAASP